MLLSFRFGCDSEKLFRFDDLQDQLKRLGYAAVPIGAMILSLKLNDANETLELDKICENAARGKMVKKNHIENKQFVTDLRGIIDDAVRYGWI